MPDRVVRTVGGLSAVVATYVSFLLWAQFGFLELLQSRVPDPGAVRLAMAVMGGTGLAASLATAPLLALLARRWDAERAAEAPVALGLGLSAIAPLLGLACHSLAAFTLAAALVGGSTAVLTVSLAARLRRLLPVRRLGLAVGSATGLAYLVCNLPGLFDGPPQLQATVVAALCVGALALVGGGLLRRRSPGRSSRSTPPDSVGTLPVGLYTRGGVAAATLSFLLLIGLDSAVFVIVQETPALAEATWSADGGTLLQGAVHLVAAVGAGALLDLAGGALFGAVLVTTGGLFAGGFALLGVGGAAATLGGALYAVGIAAYSAALVVYPGGREDEPGLVPASRRSAAVYGVAGWIGSALGVGMAQDLHRVPEGLPLAVFAGLAALWMAWRIRSSRTTRRPLPRSRSGGSSRRGLARWFPVGLAVTVAAATLAAADLPTSVAPAPGDPEDGGTGAAARAAARGRRVYVTEGCIHCHSEYVRPGTRDEVLWGPHRRDEARGTPPLIGVRRQGPDLADVGNRRTADWQRIHLIDPRALVPGSRMPSYAHLFSGDGRRGEDLVTYLQSLGAGTEHARRELIAHAAVPSRAGSVARGRTLFGRYCAPCHGADGRGDGRFAETVRGADPDGRRARTMDLTKGAFWAVSWSPADRSLETAIARTVRFGIPGTPMPGHEMLTDLQVEDLVAYVEELAWRNRR